MYIYRDIQRERERDARASRPSVARWALLVILAPVAAAAAATILKHCNVYY